MKEVCKMPKKEGTMIASKGDNSVFVSFDLSGLDELPDEA